MGKKPKKSKEQNNYSSKWFWYTVILSFFPIIWRMPFAFRNENYPYFDFKDFLFAAITLCVSNFTIIGNREIDNRDRMQQITNMSWGCSSALILTLGVVFFTEAYPNSAEEAYPTVVLFKAIGIIFVIVALFVNYTTNDFIVTSLKHKAEKGIK